MNAQGQLLGFLAYDLVLIGPFLAHFANVLPDHRLSLIIYVAVLIYRGELALYYLLRPPRQGRVAGPDEGGLGRPRVHPGGSAATICIVSTATSTTAWGKAGSCGSWARPLRGSVLGCT